MAAKAPNELTALEALRRIDAGTLTSEALIEACLQRIAEREDVVGAWQHLAADKAVGAARRADQHPTDQPRWILGRRSRPQVISQRFIIIHFIGS